MRIIDLHERFARSLVAGLLSSIVLITLNLLSYSLGLSNRYFLNYSALMIFGREFNNFAEATVSLISQIGFATSLIVISSYLVLKENRKNFFWRGGFVGFGVWFAILSLCYIIGIHKILPLNLGAAISFMITSSIWGIFAAWLLYKMDERYSAGTEIQDYKPRKIQRANHSLLSHPTNKNLIKKVEKPKED